MNHPDQVFHSHIHNYQRTNIITIHSLLDHGQIQLIDFMGNDSSVIEAARVSYDPNSTKHTSSNEKLIRYLMKNKHWSPFDQVQFKFRIKAPIFVVRQIQRHFSLKLNEVSYRYSEVPDEKYIPTIDVLTTQSTSNKQARSDQTFSDKQYEVFRKLIEDSYSEAQSSYDTLIENDIAREISRIIQPTGVYSELIVSATLRDWMSFMRQRLHPHAQYEIRVYAESMIQILKEHVPISIKAFEDFDLNSLTLSGPALSKLMQEYNISKEELVQLEKSTS